MCASGGLCAFGEDSSFRLRQLGLQKFQGSRSVHRPGVLETGTRVRQVPEGGVRLASELWR